MGKQIHISLNLRSPGYNPPTLDIIKEVEAIGTLSVTVKGEKEKGIALQPTGISHMEVLLIKRTDNIYDETIKYQVEKKSAEPITLDAPQLFFGKGSIQLLGPALHKLYFSNSGKKDVEIEILVGRRAS